MSAAHAPDNKRVDFDPQQREDFDSPHRDYKRMRHECPVAYSDAHGGFWALTRHADIVDAVTDPDLFITSKINVIPNMSLGERRPPLGKDPPEHTPYRRALDRTLRVARVRALEPTLHEHAAREMSRMIAAGSGDISTDFATIFPAWVAVEWLNLEPRHAKLLGQIAQLYNLAWRASDTDAVARTSAELYAIAEELVEDRVINPREPEADPASALLAEQTPFGPIPRAYIVATIRQALVVGLMAPPPLFGGICVHLCRDTALQDRLRSETELLPAAIEEFLRLYGPYRGFARTPTRDVTIHGRTIPKDEPVTMVYASANRDEAVFDDPDAFILGRPNITSHVSFGRGPHQCAGSALVRLEMRIFLQELLGRTQSFTLAGEMEMARLPELGPASTPVRFQAR